MCFGKEEREGANVRRRKEGRKKLTVICPRGSRRRPWHVKTCAPAVWSIFAYTKVFSTEGKTWNLSVTGTSSSRCRASTRNRGRLGSLLDEGGEGVLNRGKVEVGEDAAEKDG